MLIAVIGLASGMWALTAGRQAGQFSLAMAVLIVGYLMLPVLALLAIGLLLVSALLLAAHRLERGLRSTAGAGDERP